MPAIATGLIGFGLGGRTFHAPLIEAEPGLRLQAVASRREDEVRERFPGTRVFATPEALLADPGLELVVIASPNRSHAPLAEAALRAGKHVLVEKPFTVSCREADHLTTVAASARRVLCVYHNRRWDGDFLTIHSLLEQQTLGRLHTFESHYDRYRPEVRARWKESTEPGSGTLYDLGSHLIDQALQLFGRPLRLYADLRQQRPGSQAVDCFHLELAYEHLSVRLHGGNLVLDPGPRFVLHGDRGSFHKFGFDPQEAALTAGQLPGGDGWGEEPHSAWGTLTRTTPAGPVCTRVPTLPGDYPQLYSRLAEAIRKGGAPPVTAAQAREVVELIELAGRSSESREVIELS
jgi:scyllo-inositol 2-dehydrogenase (NADP+)